MKNRILSFIFSFSLIVFVFISVIEYACFDIHFYNTQHDKLLLNNMSINEYIGITNKELEDITNVLLDYIKDKRDDLDYQLTIKGTNREVFNLEEKQHMVDVKKLYFTFINIRNIMFIISIISLLMMIISKDVFIFKNLFYSYKNIIMIIGIIILLLGINILLDFDNFWNNFHLLFFTNDLWLLDLNKDILIMIVPPDFFNNLCIRILYLLLFSFSFIFILLYYINKRLNNDKYRTI